MRLNPAKLFFGLCSILMGATQMSAQESQRRYLVGVVTDSLDNPVAFATVQLNGASSVITAQTGTFRIDVPPAGKFTIDVRRIGFRPFHGEYAAVPDSQIRLTLSWVVHVLDPVQVASRGISSLETHGFYARLAERQQGRLNGYFITPEDIELRQPSLASQMLWDVPGVRVQMINTKPPTFTAFGANGCLGNIYVNGMRTNMLNKRDKSEEARSSVFDDIVPVGDLAGIEVYTRGSRAPTEYQSLNGSCVVVLIWTK